MNTIMKKKIFSWPWTVECSENKESKQGGYSNRPYLKNNKKSMADDWPV